MIAPTYTHPGVNAALLAMSRNRRKAFLVRRALSSLMFADASVIARTTVGEIRAMREQANAYEAVSAELARRLESDYYAPRTDRAGRAIPPQGTDAYFAYIAIRAREVATEARA